MNQLIRKKSILLFFVLVAISLDAWAANGSIEITSANSGQLYTTTGSFYVGVKATVTSDDTPQSSEPNSSKCWSDYFGRNGGYGEFPACVDGQNMSIFASIYYSIDGGREIKYPEWWGDVKGIYLPTSTSASIYVNISGLDPSVSHTVKVILKDVFSRICSWCPPQGPCYSNRECADYGNIDTETLTFRICNGSNDPCCGPNPDACCWSGNKCCGSKDPCCGNPDPCCGKEKDPCCRDKCCGNYECCPPPPPGPEPGGGSEGPSGSAGG